MNLLDLLKGYEKGFLPKNALSVKHFLQSQEDVSITYPRLIEIKNISIDELNAIVQYDKSRDYSELYCLSHLPESLLYPYIDSFSLDKNVQLINDYINLDYGTSEKEYIVDKIISDNQNDLGFWNKIDIHFFKNKNSLELVPDALRTLEICQKAVDANSSNLEFVPGKTRMLIDPIAIEDYLHSREDISNTYPRLAFFEPLPSYERLCRIIEYDKSRGYSEYNCISKFPLNVRDIYVDSISHEQAISLMKSYIDTRFQREGDYDISIYGTAGLFEYYPNKQLASPSSFLPENTLSVNDWHQLCAYNTGLISENIVPNEVLENPEFWTNYADFMGKGDFLKNPNKSTVESFDEYIFSRMPQPLRDNIEVQMNLLSSGALDPINMDRNKLTKDLYLKFPAQYYRYIPQELRNSNDFEKLAKEAFRLDPYVIGDIPDNFKDRNMLEVVVKTDMALVADFPKELLDENLLIDGIKNYKQQAIFHQTDEPGEEGLVEYEQKERSIMLQYIPNDLRTEAVCRAAVQANPENIKYVPEKDVLKMLVRLQKSGVIKNASLENADCARYINEHFSSELKELESLKENPDFGLSCENEAKIRLKAGKVLEGYSILVEGTTARELAEEGFKVDLLQKEMEQPEGKESIQQKLDKKYLFLTHQLKRYNIDINQMKENGTLDELMKGNRTSSLISLSISIATVTVEVKARLQLKEKGAHFIFYVYPQKVSLAEELNKPFLGHVFTKEEKGNLLALGNAGGVISITENGVSKKMLVSVDKLTNDIVAVEQQKVVIQDSYKNIQFTPKQKEGLLNGKPILVQGIESKDNVSLSGLLQYNAEKQRPELLQYGLVVNKVNGLELNKQQRDELSAGKTVLLPGLIDGAGEKYNAWVRLDMKSRSLEKTKELPEQQIDVRKEITPSTDFRVQTAQNTKGIKTEENKFSPAPLLSGNQKPSDSTEKKGKGQKV